MGKAGRPNKYNSASQLQGKAEEYFEYCKSEGKPLTITGLCIHLGITRETLCQYGNQEKFSDTVKIMKLHIENYIEENSLMGKLNSTVSIFNLKNNFGWVDKQEIDMNAKVETIEIKLPEELK